MKVRHSSPLAAVFKQPHLIFGFALSAVLSTGTLGNDVSEYNDWEKWLTVDSFTVEEVQDAPFLPSTSSFEIGDGLLLGPEANAGGLGDESQGGASGTFVVIDRIINYGSRLWKFIEDRAAVANVQTQRAHAVPDGVDHWTQLETWDVPRVRQYRIVYRNLYGVEVVQLTYRIIYTAGGSFQGRGQYLSNISINPSVYVAWGYKMNAFVEIPSVLNNGTSEDPIAGAELLLKWDVKGLTTDHREYSYFVRGDGEFRSLGH